MFRQMPFIEAGQITLKPAITGTIGRWKRGKDGT
jgi:hypothetical protein